MVEPLELGFSPEVWATVEAAQIQAAATMEAARQTLGAAILAFVGAIIGGFFAYGAATRQVRLHEDQYVAKALAYMFLHKLVVENMLRLIVHDKETWGNPARDNEDSSRQVKFEVYKEPEEWSEKEWESHALLGSNVVFKLYHAREMLRETINLQKQVNSKDIREGDLWKESEIEDIGSIRLNSDDGTVVHSFVVRLAILQLALEPLNEALQLAENKPRRQSFLRSLFHRVRHRSDSSNESYTVLDRFFR